MRGVRLCAANLKGANFTGAVLESADFSGARLTDAVFKDTVLDGVDMEKLNLSPEQLAGCVLGPDAAALDRAGAIRERLRRAGEWVASGGESGEPATIDSLKTGASPGFRGGCPGRVLSSAGSAIHIDAPAPPRSAVSRLAPISRARCSTART